MGISVAPVAKVNLVHEIQIKYSNPIKKSERAKVVCSEDAYNILKRFYPEDEIEMREFFFAIFVNRANEVLGVYEVSKGTMNATLVDMKLLFSPALKCLASGILISHNHPSGNLYPSQSDIQLTRKIKEASELLDITFLDHMILTNEGYYSFGDGGVL